MATTSSYPYEAVAIKKYKSPHKNDLSFAKGDRIRVLSLAPKDDDEDDDEDDEPDQWVVGETLDGSKSGTFPASHVQAAPADTNSSEQSTNAIPANTSAAEEPSQSQPEVTAAVLPSQDRDISEEVKSTPETIDTSAPPPSVPISDSTTPATAVPIPAPERKASVPPVAPKPSGLAARIAAFNKPQEAPPPLPKGKPGVWKRPAPAPGAPKPIMPGQSPAQQAKSVPQPSQESTSPPINVSNAEVSDRSNAAFSAADAQSSIKMSLKERMAALQRGESYNESAASKPAAPPKAAPGRIAEEKRSAAMAGFGGAPAVSKEPATEDDAPASPSKSPTEEKLDAESPSEAIGEGENSERPAVDEENAEVEKTEEEIESERRAAIARRMAALGGRKMGAGGAMFGAPAPPVKKPSIDTSVPQMVTDEDRTAIPSPISDRSPISASVPEDNEDTQPSKTLAVPRRAAPPRRKKGSTSSGTSVEAPSAAPATQAESDQSPSRQESITSTKESVNDSEDISHLEKTQILPLEITSKPPLVEDVEQLTEEPSSTAEVASSLGDTDFDPGTPISEGLMDEHARKLEEFIKTPMDEREEDSMMAERQPSRQGSMPPIPISSPPPPSSDATINRPPSARPPVPKTPIQGEDSSMKRISSPAPTRPPPAARSSMAEAPSPAPTRVPPTPKTPTQRDTQQFSSNQEDDEEDEEETRSVQAPILAAPKARMAVPMDPSDDEGEAEPDAEEKSAAPVEAPQEPEEMTEEEEDRQRRARIAAKMAKMGGMPIMGAPMAFKKPSTKLQSNDKEPVKEDLRGLEPEEEIIPSVDSDSALRANQSPTREKSEVTLPPVPATASPPPIPTAKSPPPMPRSPPPMPTKSPPPMMAGGASLDKRFSQMSTSTDEDTSLGRRASLLNRPPVPGKSSREASNAEEESAEEIMAAMPKSPPPRAPPRAPPPARQPSLKRNEEVAPLPVPPETPTKADLPSKSSRDSVSIHKRAQSASRSSRDLDLMPSSQWWRHGKPVKLPPTLSRPDVLPIISINDEGSTHFIRVELIFEDYTSTTIEVQYQDDDANEEETQLSQHHNFAPRRPNTAELQSWSQQYGAALARVTLSALQSKAVLGNGTSKGFISELIVATGIDEILPGVGSSFGSIILAQAATTPVDTGADEIRAGDVIALHGVDLKGKKGIASYHATFGSTQEPTYACIIESEAKKRKLRCILVPGTEAKKASKIPEEVSLRLDDVKSGLLRVFRLAPKNGWLNLS